jgi:hypothetical protein
MSTANAIALVPFVPGGKDFDKSRDLFRELGFRELWSDQGYVGFANGGARFILQDLDVPSLASNFMITIEVPDLDVWWAETDAKQLPDKHPGFKLRPPHVFPWGREVHFIDLAGVCWHVRVP